MVGAEDSFRIIFLGWRGAAHCAFLAMFLFVGLLFDGRRYHLRAETHADADAGACPAGAFECRSPRGAAQAAAPPLHVSCDCVQKTASCGCAASAAKSNVFVARARARKRGGLLAAGNFRWQRFGL